MLLCEITQLAETMDSPLPWRWENKPLKTDKEFNLLYGMSWIALFATPSKNVYIVKFNTNSRDDEMYDLEFALIDSNYDNHTDMTNTGDEIKVFATVLDILKAFVNERKPEGITFSAGNKHPKRAKLYSKLAKMVPGYSVHAQDGSTDRSFLMIREGTQLNEFGDDPVKYKWLSTGGGFRPDDERATWVANFKVDDQKYWVEFNWSDMSRDQSYFGEGTYQLTFGTPAPETNYDDLQTSYGNEVKVLSTVYNILKDFLWNIVEQDQIQVYVENPGQTKLYKRLIKIMIDNGWELEQEPIFTKRTKNDYPVPSRTFTFSRR